MSEEPTGDYGELLARVDDLGWILSDEGKRNEALDIWLAYEVIRTLLAKVAELEANINLKADFIEATLNDAAATDAHIETVNVNDLCQRAADERQALIVKWLRGQEDSWFDRSQNASSSILRGNYAAGFVAIQKMADAIERGDHLQTKPD